MSRIRVTTAAGKTYTIRYASPFGKSGAVCGYSDGRYNIFRFNPTDIVTYFEE